MWAISPEERNKHDQKFDTLSPSMGYVSGTGRRIAAHTAGFAVPTAVFPHSLLVLHFQHDYTTRQLFQFRFFIFLSLSAGEQARKFFLQSGLPASVLAEIW